MFIDQNKDALALDVARGEGERLTVLQELLGVSSADKAVFARVAQRNYTTIFAHPGVDTSEIIAGLRTAMVSQPELARYVASL